MAPYGVPTALESPYPVPGSFTFQSRLSVSRLAAERLVRSIELLLRRGGSATWFVASCDATADALDVVAFDYADVVHWGDVMIAWSDSDAETFDAGRRSDFAEHVHASFVEVSELAASPTPLHYL